MASEAGFWALLKRNTPQVVWQRLETGVVGRGTPDLIGRHPHTPLGYTIWVELKYITGNKISLTPEQVGWHMRWSSAGATTWILIRQFKEGPRIGKVDRIYLYQGVLAKEIFQQGVKYPTRFVWEKPFPWPTIEETLFDHKIAPGAVQMATMPKNGGAPGSEEV